MSIEINGAGVITGVDSLSTPAVTNAAGSASAPGISFNGDPNTGIYSPGADQVAISTGGSGRLFVDASGRILSGVASSSASLSLQIQGNAGNTAGAAVVHLNRGETGGDVTATETLGVIRFCDSANLQGAVINGIAAGTWSGSSSPADITLSTTPASTTTPQERLRVTSAGLVGIGTSSPATTFDLAGAYSGNASAVSALDIDCSAGNYFTKTINGNSTFTVSNVPANRSYAFTLELEHTSGTITWFSGVEWPNGVAPTLTTGKTHLFMFQTDNGGSRWRASSLINYTT